MAGVWCKWLLVPLLLIGTMGRHPIFVSVMEINYNEQGKAIELSCKVFTDDFEQALRQAYRTRIDLLDIRNHKAMDPLVNDYLSKHLRLSTNGRPATLKFLGFEQQEEGIVAFYEGTFSGPVTTVSIESDILYEAKEQQMGIIHVTVGGTRKSTKLNNPERVAKLEF